MMIKGLKLAHRKKKLKRLLMHRSKALKDFKNYRRHQNEYNRMKRMKGYLRSDMQMLGNVSNLSGELNAITSIVIDDEMYKQVMKDLKSDIRKAKQRR